MNKIIGEASNKQKRINEINTAVKQHYVDFMMYCILNHESRIWGTLKEHEVYLQNKYGSIVKSLQDNILAERIYTTLWGIDDAPLPISASSELSVLEVRQSNIGQVIFNYFREIKRCDLIDVIDIYVIAKKIDNKLFAR